MPRLTSIKLNGFKRFNDLTIAGIPGTAKLVIVAGPNGNGKSSLFDAFRRWSYTNSHRASVSDIEYFNRRMSGADNSAVSYENQGIELTFHQGPIAPGTVAAKKAFYIRTAYRNDPELTIRGLQQLGSVLDEAGIQRLIDNDATVTKNYQRLVSEAFNSAFDSGDGEQTLSAWREMVVGELRDSLKRLFPELVLNGLGSPMRDPNFRFDKGLSRKFVYKNLSGGEKAAFDLLLDVIVKRKEYNDTVFCIDEPEVHINPKLHGKFLSELLELLPDKCQLWLATHSIGMMRRARDISRLHPESVAFLDFGAPTSFDIPVTLTPSKPTRLFWARQLDVALHDLADLVAPQTVVVCEGNPSGFLPQKNAEHDALCYSHIFEEEFPEVIFVAGGNCHDIISDRMSFASKLPAIVQGMTVQRLIDRDDHGEADIKLFTSQGINVLQRRNIEAYLWDDDPLKRLCSSRGQSAAISDILAKKVEELQASINRGNAPNDLKPAAPSMFNFVRKRLGIIGEGNDARAFERNVLSKSFTTDMPVYKELKASLFS